MSASEAKRWEAAQKKKRAAAAKKRAAAKPRPAAKAARPAARPSNGRAPAKKAPRGKVWRKGYTRSDGVKVPGTWVKKVKKGQKRYRVRSYVKKSGRVVKSYMRRRPGVKRKTTSRAKTRTGYIWRKGYVRADGKRIKGTWVKKASTKRRKARSKVKVKSYLRRVPGRKARKRVKTYTRKAPKRRRVMRRNPPRRPSKKAVWVKGYTRSDGVRVKGHYMKPSTKRRKKTTKKTSRRRAAPKRRRSTRVASYMRKVPGKRKRVRVKSYARKLAPKRRRAAPKRRRSTRVASYMRKVPGKRKRVRVKSYARKLAPKRRRAASKRKNGRRAGKIVRVKGYTRSDGVRVKGYSYRMKKGGRRKAKVVRNRGRSPIMNAARMGLLTNSEKRALAKRMRRNPSGMMGLLPATDQLMLVGKKVGIGAVGFGGAVAAGVALNRVPMLTRYFGSWTPVLGNVAAGLGYWALASAMDNEDLKGMRVPVAVGAGLAAVFNIANQLVARQTIPANVASWILPGAGAVAAAPTEAVEPTINGGNGVLINGNGDGTAGFGQIDVYEAALDGFGGIEEELEMEMSHMGGMGDGVFDTSPDGIFDGMSGAGEYLSTPMGATVEEAYAGTGEYLSTPMGAMVEEAYAGTGEYLDVPMGEYLSSPMGATVEEAYAGTGEYLSTSMGATVEEAYAGMGAAPSAQIEQSLRNRPLMPGFRQAVQKMVRKRVAQGKPINDAFYGKVGKAAAAMARKKFQERAALVAGKPQSIAREPWKAPLLRSSAPTYKRNIGDPSMVPGVAEPIAKSGPAEYEGVFQDSDTDGIF
jgi:hypothetical protein